MHPQVASAVSSSWWGYAEADPVVVGILVGCVAVFAVVFVATRILRGRSSGAGKSQPSRGESWRS